MVFLLFVVIFIEGYVVLASELIAIRLIIPWVGSGTEVISIVIAAVLMPLAFGYYAGGQYRKNCKNKIFSIRNKLLSNLKISSVILTFGLSYVVLDVFFSILYGLDIVHRLLQTVIYSGVFLVYPVFLLGQTIPLISNYFSRASLSEMTGKMLMISTLGSFGGAVISTVFLMSFIGVNNTVIFVILLLSFLIVLISPKRQNILFALFISSLVIFLNNDAQMNRLGIINNNAYNTVKIINLKDDENNRIMALNNNYSSSYKEGVGSIYNYIQYINNSFIYPLKKMDRPKDILILGAAGFTLGLHDTYNNYTFVDIDPDLKKIAEDNFLQYELSDNKKFIAVAARGFLTKSKRSGQKFDLIILDTFKAGFSMPEHLLTQEYFGQVKKALKPKGFVVINTVAAANFKGKFSKRLDNTIRSVFPYVTRVAMAGFEGETYNAWRNFKDEYGFYTTNVVYSYYHDSITDKDVTIYTDNKNTYFLDK